MDILIIDDEPAVRRSFAKMLERAGYMDGQSATAWPPSLSSENNPYRVIVCDVN